MLKLKKLKGFTLIELLVVIAIVGLLSTIASMSLNSARASARDAKRISDVKQMQTALEMYFNEMGQYPGGNICASSSLASASTVYLTTIPEPPTPADGDCSDNNIYSYTQTSSGSSYTISFCLGKDIANGPSGGLTTIATPLDMTSQAAAPACTPDCASKECGDDGCGGSCGLCPPDYTCVTNMVGNYCWPDGGPFQPI